MKNDNDLLELKLQLATLRMAQPKTPAQHRRKGAGDYPHRCVD